MDETSQKNDALNVWVIEPHEPLIFRDGRPFNLKPGIIAQSLPFPFPSTTTGGVRSQAGLNEQGVFVYKSKDQLETLKQLKVRGPLLVQITHHDEGDGREKEDTLEWFVPAPADALLLKPGDDALKPGDDALKPGDDASSEIKALLKRLVPIKTTVNELTDLTSVHEDKGKPPLHLVGMQQYISGKPVEKPPRYWKWHVFQEWLLNPEENKIKEWSDLGIVGLAQEERTHVGMDRENHKGKDGALFATRGMEFVAFNEDEGLQKAHPLGLAMILEKDAQPVPRENFATFGGERRIVRWRNYTSNTLSCPTELIEKIVVGEDKVWSCRMILLTPAYFKEGFYPTEIQKEQDGVKPIIKAIAIQRPEVISGWDLVSRVPKKTRRLAPAGTVFFLELQGEQEAIRNWVRKYWLQCISDNDDNNEPQDCNDGFGLAVIGTWDGQLHEMKIGE
ncbi:MAG: type III-B CRISPR module-associated protein Cmr3 [Ktedonobacteraceae bacterium]|nr:type III-B CRISPR module-associated protein Cmr3 [Ktedonobacteraceae bacterium]